MNLRKLINPLGLLLCLLFTFTVFAQNRVLKGRVTDAAGNGIPGVSVVVKGQSTGTVTGNDGSYTLSVPSGSTTLQFSSVGYGTSEVAIGGRDQVSATLQSTSNNMNEVVVIGYGTRQRRDLTGSVASVTSKDFQQGVISTPEQLISGKIAGVVVTPNGGAPGSGGVIRIRGAASLNASNDPLIIVDGVPLENSGIAGAANALSLINPNDIEAISVLKDASAAAIYGNRASNGVIIITTKKGRSGGKLQVNFNTVTGLSVKENQVQVLNAYQLRTFVDLHGSAAQSALLGTANTDWQSRIYRTAVSTDNSISLTGGIKGLPYRISFGTLAQAGILKSDNLKRNSVAFNLSPTLFNNTLHIDLNLKGTLSESRFADQGAIGSAVRMDPTKPVYDPNSVYGGYYEWQTGNIPNGQATRNPLALLYLNENVSNVKRSIGNLQLDYKIPYITGLRANLNLGYDISKGQGHQLIPYYAASNYSNGGYFSKYSQYNRTKLLDFYFNYAKDLKGAQSRFDFTAGYGYQDFFRGAPSFPVYRADLTQRLPAGRGDSTQHTLISFYGRLNYTFKDKFLLTATVRQDGSSRFAPNNRWGTFPSAALAWRISQEGFMKGSNLFSDLKARIGYGVTGQQDIGGDYPYLPLYTYGSNQAQYPLGNGTSFTYRPEAYDPRIKWETTTAYNAGLDFGLLKNRINGSLDFYYKKTNDILLDVPTAAGSNLSNHVTTNVGNLENKGVELNLNALVISHTDFSWNANFNIAYNKNKILKLSVTPDTASAGIAKGGIGGGTGNTIQILTVGYPAYTFYAYKQVYDANGHPIEGVYADVNKNNGSNYFYRYKSPDPKVTIGFSSQFNYKQLTMSFVIRGDFGNYVYNNVAAGSTWNSVFNSLGYLGNTTTELLNSNFQNSQYFSDYYIENASFVKLDNLTLGYNFGKVIRHTNNLRVSFIVQNVLTFTKYSGLDPEVFNGIDNNIYPRPRTFSLGANLNF